MTTLPTFRLVAACMHAIPALVWSIIALEFWRILRRGRTRSTLFVVLLLLTGAFTLHMVLHVIIELTPDELGRPPESLHGPLEAVLGLLSIAMAPLLLHAVELMPLRPEPRSRLWLAANYGSAALATLASARLFRHRAEVGESPWLAPGLIGLPYLLGTFLLALARGFASSRHGRWRQGPAVVELRSPDLFVLSASLVLGATMLFALAATAAISAGRAWLRRSTSPRAA